jgi:hypothetical protein
VFFDDGIGCIAERCRSEYVCLLPENSNIGLIDSLGKSFIQRIYVCRFEISSILFFISNGPAQYY